MRQSPGANLMLCSVIGAAVVWYVFATSYSRLTDSKEKRKLLAVAIRTTASALWPVVLMSFIQPCDRSNRLLWVPILWNALLHAVDVMMMYTCDSADGKSLPSLKLDMASLTGLGFGLCSLLGSRPDSKYAHLFLYAIFGCFLLVFPSHNLSHDCVVAQVFDSVQRSALLYCTGILVAAVVLTRQHQLSTTAAQPSSPG